MAFAPQSAVTASPVRVDVVMVALAFLIIMVDGFDLQAIGYVAPEIAAKWSVPMSAFGPVFSAALAGSILGAVLAGPATLIFGLRAGLALSLALFGVLSLVVPQAADLFGLGVLRLLSGVGLGATVPIAVGLVARHSVLRWRTTLLTLTLCGQPLGAILGGALCARLIPVYGWPAAFYLGGVLPLLLAVALWVSPAEVASQNLPSAEVPGTDAGGRFRELFEPAHRLSTTLMPASVFLSSGFLYLIVNWLPGVMRGAGYALADSVLAVSAFNFGGIAGALLAARLIDRLGPFKVLPLLYVLAACSTALLGWAIPDRAALLIAAGVSGLAGYGAAINLGPLALMLYPPRLHTTGLGWALGVGRLGAVAGPLAVGMLIAAGLAAARLFYLAAAAMLLAMVCVLTLAATRRLAAARRR